MVISRETDIAPEHVPAITVAGHVHGGLLIMGRNENGQMVTVTLGQREVRQILEAERYQRDDPTGPPGLPG